MQVSSDVAVQVVSCAALCKAQVVPILAHCVKGVELCGVVWRAWPPLLLLAVMRRALYKKHVMVRIRRLSLGGGRCAQRAGEGGSGGPCKVECWCQGRAAHVCGPGGHPHSALEQPNSTGPCMCPPAHLQAKRSPKVGTGFPPCHAYMDVHASAPHRRRPSRHLPLVMANSLSKERVKVTSKECLKSANWTALA